MNVKEKWMNIKGVATQYYTNYWKGEEDKLNIRFAVSNTYESFFSKSFNDTHLFEKTLKQLVYQTSAEKNKFKK